MLSGFTPGPMGGTGLQDDMKNNSFQSLKLLVTVVISAHVSFTKVSHVAKPNPPGEGSIVL